MKTCFPNQKQNFIQQQGFNDLDGVACPWLYGALLFQPWVVTALVVAGTLFQSASVFAVLAGLLYWSAAFPKLNPFEATWNSFNRNRVDRQFLSPAPTPRRFTQALAGTLALIIAVALFYEWNMIAWAFQGLFLTALVALIGFGFCLGSFVFHVIVGHSDFAKRTLPWA
jgi:hypothetical protein